MLYMYIRLTRCVSPANDIYLTHHKFPLLASYTSCCLTLGWASDT